jgi:hypothetical protein
MKQKQLAEALGLSEPSITRCKAQGMPTHSVEAAKRWRDANLETKRRKEFRPGYELLTRGMSPDVVVAQALLDAAAQMIGATGSLHEAMVEPLRKALRCVPEHLRFELALPAPVMRDLTKAALAAVPGTPPGQSVVAETASIVGALWFAVAAGEVRLVAGGAVRGG